MVCWGSNSQGQASAPPGSYTLGKCRLDAFVRRARVRRSGLLGSELRRPDECADGKLPLRQRGPLPLVWGVGVGWSRLLGVSRAVLTAPGSAPLRIDYGQTYEPPGSYRAVSAGEYYTCALSESGKIVCWGDGYGDPNPRAGTFSSISSGWQHACGWANRARWSAGVTKAPARQRHLRGATCR